MVKKICFFVLILFSCKINVQKKSAIELLFADKYIFSATLPARTDTTTKIILWLYPTEKTKKLKGFYILAFYQKNIHMHIAERSKAYGIFSETADTLILQPSINMKHNKELLENLYRYTGACEDDYMMVSKRVFGANTRGYYNPDRLDSLIHFYDDVNFEIFETKFLISQTNKISKKESVGCLKQKNTLNLSPLASSNIFLKKYSSNNPSLYFDFFQKNTLKFTLHQWHSCVSDTAPNISAIHDFTPTEDTCQPPNNRQIYNFLLQHTNAE